MSNLIHVWCPRCGVEFGLTEWLYGQRRKAGRRAKTFCPSGHPMTWRLPQLTGTVNSDYPDSEKEKGGAK